MRATSLTAHGPVARRRSPAPRGRRRGACVHQPHRKWTRSWGPVTTNDILRNEVYDLSGPLPLMIEDGPTAYITGPDGLPIEQVTENGDVRYFSHDQLGSTTALTDEDGDTVASYDYDAYGNLTSSPPSVENPFRYAGQFTDSATGLQYLRARYYEPATGQFLSRDPLVTDTRQPYSYGANSPTNYVDPSGLIFGIPGTPSVSEIGMGISGGAASALDGLSGGLSTKLAGKAFGFDSECADFGPLSGVGQAVGVGGGFLVGGGGLRLGVEGGRGVLRRIGRRLADERGSVGYGELPRRARTFDDFDEAAKHLQDFHGVNPRDASRRLHAIKQHYGIRDNLLIDRTGNVYNPYTRERLGSLTTGF